MHTREVALDVHGDEKTQRGTLTRRPGVKWSGNPWAMKSQQVLYYGGTANLYHMCFVGVILCGGGCFLSVYNYGTIFRLGFLESMPLKIDDCPRQTPYLGKIQRGWD